MMTSSTMTLKASSRGPRKSEYEKKSSSTAALFDLTGKDRYNDPNAVWQGEIVNWYRETLQVQTQGKGMFQVTGRIQDLIKEWGIQEGMCYLFIQHTSASLAINESYDPTAKRDIEAFMERLAPEGESWHQHTLEGPDDSPSHMRSLLTATSLTIPVDGGELNLGTWQGVFVFEHRTSGSRRKILVRCLGVT